jgi:hypothetical protein
VKQKGIWTEWKREKGKHEERRRARKESEKSETERNVERM